MAKRRSQKSPSDSAFSGAAPDQRIIHNAILRSLPRDEIDLLFPELEFAELTTHERLSETGAPIQFGWFVDCGLASVLTVMRDGKSVAVGLIGKEGFVGLPLVVGLNTSANRVVMQVEGSGYRVRGTSLVPLLIRCPQLKKGLHRYAQEFGLQSAQAAACNRLHGVEQRLARWLLMSQDRLGGEIVPLTQESLAHTLGIRRARVTVAAGLLQNHNLIKSSRGSIVIVDRDKLEAAACECYEMMMRQARNWHNETR